jgi:hypothetical protein
MLSRVCKRTRERAHTQSDPRAYACMCARIILYNSAVISQQSFSLFHLVFCGWRKRERERREDGAQANLQRSTAIERGNEIKRIINMRESSGERKNDIFLFSYYIFRLAQKQTLKNAIKAVKNKMKYPPRIEEFFSKPLA